MEFSASHTLGGRRQYGHNYVLEVTLSGEVDPDTGMLMDLKELKDVLEREVGARFDHKNLNADTPYFRERPPTGENFARVLFELLDAAIPNRWLHRIRLFPQADTTIEVER